MPLERYKEEPNVKTPYRNKQLNHAPLPNPKTRQKKMKHAPGAEKKKQK